MLFFSGLLSGVVLTVIGLVVLIVQLAKESDCA